MMDKADLFDRMLDLVERLAAVPPPSIRLAGVGLIMAAQARSYDEFQREAAELIEEARRE